MNVLLTILANALSNKSDFNELQRTLRWTGGNKSLIMHDYKMFFNDSNQFWIYGNHIFVPKEYNFQDIADFPANQLLSKFNKKFELCCTLNVKYNVEYTMKLLRPLIVDNNFGT